MSTNSLQQFLDEQQSMVEQAEIDSAIAYWDAAICASPEGEERAARLAAELDSKYSDPARFERLKSFGEATDPSLARQRRLLLDEFERNQMPRDVIDEIARREMEIEGVFSNFRATLNGTPASENDIREVLKVSNDSVERRAAWEAGKQIGGQVAGKLLALVDIRNKEARRAGYKNYYAMAMKLQELDESELFATLEQVSTELEPVFLARKAIFDESLARRFGVSTAELRPWHYGDPFFQEAPGTDNSLIDSLFAECRLEDVLTRFFTALGLSIDSLLPRADLYEKPGKNQHAYCLSVGRGTGDIRVNCNLRPDSKWMATLLHEFGHAVYDNEIDPDLPFFLKSVSHIMVTEAIAEMMGRFVTNANWLKRWIDLPVGETETIAREAVQTQKAQMVVFTQWVQVITHFERELYSDPGQDLGALWWNLVERYQHVAAPEDRNPYAWASKIHLSTSPVYYHNYLMGEMIASQLLATMRKSVIASDAELVDSPAVGKWLIDNVFRPGARYDWNALVERATGEPLNPSYFVHEMSA